MKIKEFSERMQINQNLLVSAVKSGITNSGAPYLSITFKDDSGQIEGKLWDVKEEQKKVIKAGEVALVRADVLNYRNNLQLKVLNVTPLDQSTVDINEFIQASPVNTDQLREEIYSEIDSIHNEKLYKIVSHLYTRFDEEIFSSPAAVRNHHEFKGGLATHIVSMARLAEHACRMYPIINHDLLIAGVLLHDIGKIRELGSLPVTQYTLEGNLIGHVSISQTMVQEACDELEIEGEEVILLRHMILSHHGQYDYGSPVLPSTVEAIALHMIDDFDAKMTMLDRELSQIREGEFTGRIFSLDNRAFYKGRTDGEQ